MAKDKWKYVREIRYYVYRISPDGLLKPVYERGFEYILGYLTMEEAAGAILVDARERRTCASLFTILPIVEVHKELET